jgi:hypothetical protein
MDATRFRFGAVVEWAVAAGAIVTGVALASFVEREIRTVTAGTPVIARAAAAQPAASPAGIPAGAVSLPVLLLSDGTEVYLGDTQADVAARLGDHAETAAPTVERAPHGERVTRTYDRGGIRFRLVFEPFDQGAEPRVTAIYR